MDRYDEESNRILVLKTTHEIPFLTPITMPIASLNPEAWDGAIEDSSSEYLDIPQCYLCGTDDPEDEITKVELPHQIVDVCGRCEASYQHQEMVRQEYGSAESEV